MLLGDQASWSRRICRPCWPPGARGRPVWSWCCPSMPASRATPSSLARCCGAVMQAQGGRGVREWRRAHPAQVQALALEHARCTTDVDTPEDLRRLGERWGCGSGRLGQQILQRLDLLAQAFVLGLQLGHALPQLPRRRAAPLPLRPRRPCPGCRPVFLRLAHPLGGLFEILRTARRRPAAPQPIAWRRPRRRLATTRQT